LILFSLAQVYLF